MRQASGDVGVAAFTTTNGSGPSSNGTKPLVSVILPTLNEAANLPHVLPRLPSWIHELVLVDGHSTDGTVEVAREYWPDVRVVHQTARGKGNALACGISACRGDIAVLLDGDGSTDPEEIPLFVDAITHGAEFVKGSRLLGRSDDLTLLRRAGNWALTRLVNLLYGTSYTDLCYGFNAVRMDCADKLRLDCDGFEVETLMGIRAAKAGLRVVEVPSWERNRIHGVSRLNTFRDGWRVLMTIFRERRLPGTRLEAATTNEGVVQELA